MDLSQTWYVACDEFYILSNFEVTRPKVNVTGAMAKITKLHFCLQNAHSWCIVLQLSMHVACDEFYILLKVKVIRSKVKISEVMAATRASCHTTHLIHTHLICYCIISPRLNILARLWSIMLIIYYSDFHKMADMVYPWIFQLVITLLNVGLER